MEINKSLSAVASKFVPSNPFLITTGRPFLPIRANATFPSKYLPPIQLLWLILMESYGHLVSTKHLSLAKLVKVASSKPGWEAPDISHSTWSQTWGPCHWPPLGSKVKMSRFHGTTCANLLQPSQILDEIPNWFGSSLMIRTQSLQGCDPTIWLESWRSSGIFHLVVALKNHHQNLVKTWPQGILAWNAQVKSLAMDACHIHGWFTSMIEKHRDAYAICIDFLSLNKHNYNPKESPSSNALSR